MDDQKLNIVAILFTGVIGVFCLILHFFFNAGRNFLSIGLILVVIAIAIAIIKKPSFFDSDEDKKLM